MNEEKVHHPIQQLDHKTTSLIAAGEIIERPSSVLQELIDNAIDAHASNITVESIRGGIDLLRISDNGTGMSKDDLSLCWKNHTTSKINSIQDLENNATLGFRGEALHAITSVSHTVITSHMDTLQENSIAHKLVVSHGKLKTLSACSRKKGSTIEVRELFHRLPARKQFLKHPTSEYTAIKSVLQEMALSFPNIEFRLYNNKELKLFYKPSSLLHRCAKIFNLSPSALRSVSHKSSYFSMEIVYSLPTFFRSDRKKIWVFVNNRRIRDYLFLQSIEYAYRETLHGGLFPYVALLLQVAPQKVDFNIHPAKKEVRIQHIQEIHHDIVTVLRSILLSHTSSKFTTSTKFIQRSTNKQNKYVIPHKSTTARESALHYLASQNKREPNKMQEYHAPINYIGQLYSTYLICLYKENLYLVDQHASHEKRIYMQLHESHPIQNLLIPIDVFLSHHESKLFTSQISTYQKLGIHIIQSSALKWQIDAIPAHINKMETVLTQTIKELSTVNTENLYEKIIEQISCKGAIKAGDIITQSAAIDLLNFVFTLQHPYCPHGRPLFVHITKKELDERIGRITTRTNYKHPHS